MVMVQLKNGLAALALALTFSCGGTKVATDKDEKAPAFDGVTEASALSDGWTQVTWDAADDDVSDSARIVYRVYVGAAGASVDYSARVAVSPAGATSVGVQGLPQGVDLEIAVRAVDEAGNEDTGTKTFPLKLPDLLPPQFAGVTAAVGLSGSSLEIKWPDPREGSPVNGFVVYLSKLPTPVASAKGQKVSASKRSLVVEDLEEATTYYAAVRATDDDGDDGNRKVVAGSTLDATAPIFTGLAAATAGGTAVLLTWDAGSDLITAPEALTYNIYATQGSAPFDFRAPLTSVVGQTTNLVSGLAPSVEYHFIVRAKDAAGNEETNELSQTTTTGATADTTPPVFAGLASAATLTSQSILLSWAVANDDLTPDSAIVYDIWHAVESGAEALTGAPDFTSAPGASNFEYGGLLPTTTHFFIVRARDIAGLRDANTIEHSGNTKSDDTPPIFAGAAAVTGLNATSVQVTWQAASDDFGASTLIYDVYFATSPGGQNWVSPSQTVPNGGTSATFTGLVRSTPYYAVVRVRDPDGNAEYNTNEASGSTLPDTTPPVFPSTPSVSALSPTSLQVSWTAATDDSYVSTQLAYQVFYKRSSTGTYTAGPTVAAGAPTSANLTGLSVSSTYNIYIKAVDPSGNEGVSNVGSANTSADTTAPTFGGTPTFAGTTTATPDNSITLTWPTASDNVSSNASIFYEICVSTSPGTCATTFSVYATTAAGVLTRTLTGFPLDVRYYFQIRAVDEAGQRARNTTELGDTTVPGTAAAPSITFSGAAANVTWSAVSDSQFTNLRYRIEYWGDTWNGSACDSNPITGATLAARTVGGTTAVKAFIGNNYARVVAIDGFGNATIGNWSANYPQISAAGASNVLQPLWNAGCNLGGCHGGPVGGYPIWTVVSVKQSPSPVGYAGAVIIPNNIAGSRMHDRVTRTDSSRMPPGSVTPPNDLICNLRRWISAGAP